MKYATASLGLDPDIALKEAIDETIALWDQQDNCERYKEAQKQNLKSLLKVYDRKMRVRDFTREALVDLVKHFQRRDVDVFHHLVPVKRFFALMVEEGVIAVNPVQYRRLPFTMRPHKLKPIITEEQWQKLYKESVSPVHPDWMPTAILIGWWTGLRSIDVACIQWSHNADYSYVDFENDQIVARPSKLRKKNQRLQIPIAAELGEYLRAFQLIRDRDTEFVMQAAAHDFLYTEGRRFREAVEDLFLACKMPGYSFHCFRHSFVTRCLRAKVSPIIIGDMTGQSLRTIQRYSRVGMQDKVDALKAL